MINQLLGCLWNSYSFLTNNISHLKSSFCSHHLWIFFPSHFKLLTGKTVVTNKFTLKEIWALGVLWFLFFFASMFQILFAKMLVHPSLTCAVYKCITVFASRSALPESELALWLDLVKRMWGSHDKAFWVRPLEAFPTAIFWELCPHIFRITHTGQL